MEEQKSEEKIIEERKEKLKKIVTEKQIWVLLVLIGLIILGVYIRTLPMQTHQNGNPGLWDITTNSWTLGPDLDPWLFERYAKTMIVNGNLPRIDTMRNVPEGFDTTTELQMVSYMIVLTYKIVNMFGTYPIEFAAAFMPVLLFALTIISFFLFVREVFIRKDSEDKNLKANLIALISTLFMILIPVFLSRTVAGIPEKESVAFFFMFLAFYLFLKAWKNEKIYVAGIFGILSGISTAIMALTWGGISYIYATLAIFGFFALILNKIQKKEFMVYTLWLIVTFVITFSFTNRSSVKGFITSLDTGLVIFVVFASLINLIVWNTKLSKTKFLEKIKLPKSIISIIIAVIIGIFLVLLFLGPSFILEKIGFVNKMMFKPVQGRWMITVAENAQPYYSEWSRNFGPFIKNIPIMFWLFFIGSVVLFKNMLKDIKKKDAWILTGFYLFFLIGIIFSRYAPHPAILDGEGIASRLLYYLSALMLACSFAYYYIKYYREGNFEFEKIDYQYLFLFALFVLCLFTARSAVRLIMVLGPIAPIFASYLTIESSNRFFKTKDETGKMIWGIIAILVIVMSIICVFGIPGVSAGYYQQVKGESYNFVPTFYNQQWQKAMQWVRDETPKDAVFAHWWDYGYWVQSIGDRATVLDGGNAKVFWNYWMGRLVLTGDNQKDSLEFLYNHNATYLLIDSSDIGKYGAFSSIGSNATYDRYSWIGTYLLDEKQIQETKNQTIYVYSGGVALDEDLIINESGKQILLPGQKVAVGLIVLPIKKTNKTNESQFDQPYVVIGNQIGSHKVNLRYLSIDGKFIDFKEGIEACAYIFPSVISQGQGLGQNPLGAAMFLSPRLMKGYLAQKYILNDPLNKFPNFKVVHNEPNLIVDSLNKQGMNLPEE